MNTTPQTGMATNGVAMPEWLDRKDVESGSWTVEQGLPVRGAAWTNISERRMTVPVGGDEASRIIRAHEMMHAKVSPVVLTAENCGRVTTASASAVIAAEEARVNYLVGSAGFDIDLLADGSEKITGQRMAAAGIAATWNNAVEFIMATFGTKACNTFITGVRSVDEGYAKMLRSAVARIRKEHRKLVRSWGRERIASTEAPESLDGITMGFHRYTVPMAELLERLMLPKMGAGGAEQTDEEVRREATDRAKGRATWARLVLDKNVLLTKHLDGKIGRKRIASATGRNPRHLDRMLTDPERRVFDRRARGKGGVVVIDQSGSMSLTTEQISAMVEAAPACVIIGYSHPTRQTDKPNAWVIANRGKVAESWPEGGNGNGVDGPVVRHALTMRRTGEPFIWVCDGMVTDGEGDHYHDHLGEECAALVVKHRIHMVGTPEEAIAALRTAQSQSLPTVLTGTLRYTQVAAVSNLAG